MGVPTCLKGLSGTLCISLCPLTLPSRIRCAGVVAAHERAWAREEVEVFPSRSVGVRATAPVLTRL